jgi:hypothetical protein
MLEIFGEHYFLDLDEIENYVQIPNPLNENNTGDLVPLNEEEQPRFENQYSIVKYDLIKHMIVVLLDSDIDADPKLGHKSLDNMEPSTKLIFNTLLNKKILRHY